MGPDGLNRVGQASKLPNSAEKVLKLAEKQAETRAKTGAETRQITAEKVRFFKVSRVKKSNFSSKTFSLSSNKKWMLVVDVSLRRAAQGSSNATVGPDSSVGFAAMSLMMNNLQ